MLQDSRFRARYRVVFILKALPALDGDLAHIGGLSIPGELFAATPCHALKHPEHLAYEWYLQVIYGLADRKSRNDVQLMHQIGELGNSKESGPLVVAARIKSVRNSVTLALRLALASVTTFAEVVSIAV